MSNRPAPTNEQIIERQNRELEGLRLKVLHSTELAHIRHKATRLVRSYEDIGEAVVSEVLKMKKSERRLGNARKRLAEIQAAYLRQEQILAEIAFAFAAGSLPEREKAVALIEEVLRPAAERGRPFRAQRKTSATSPTLKPPPPPAP